MLRQPKELFCQEGDIGCCQPDKEVGLISDQRCWQGGLEAFPCVDIEDGQSHMPYVLCTLSAHMDLWV